MLDAFLTRSRLGLLALGLLCCVATSSAGAQLPPYWSGSTAAFYELPSADIQNRALGSIYRFQRFTPSAVLTVNSDGVIAYRVMYVSTDANGDKRLVTGAILMPVRVYAPSRPILGLAVGSQGMADLCASSRGIATSTNYDLTYMRMALDLGWAVAVTDYQGLGTTVNTFPQGVTDEHVQVVGTVLGRNVLDSVRAARQLNTQFNNDRAAYFPWKFAISGNMSLASKVVLWGYSEGGAASAWAGELQPTYAPELKLVGVAAGGVPADMLRVGRAMDNPSNLQNVSFGALVAASIGYAQAYEELRDDLAEENLSPTGRSLVSSVKGQCLIDQIIEGFGGYRARDLTADGRNLLDDPLWQARFDENKLGYGKPPVPVFLYHGVLDEAIEYNQARDLARSYCNQGVRVSWNPYFGDHVTGYLQGMGAALDFLNNRVNGWFTNAIVCSAIY
jgi:hypothetical protein